MTRLLILVHGMGSHPPNWSDGIKKKLDEVASRYTAFGPGKPSFTSQLDIAEVRYDGIFDHYVDTWQQSGAEFKKFFDAEEQASGAKFDQGAVANWLTDTSLPDDARSFFWSTALDPILYRASPLVRDDVRSTVMAQIVSHITSRTGGGAVPVSIMAHSLGTIVTHDVLYQLASGMSGGNRAFEAARWQFTNLFMLANVCVLGPPALIDLHPAKHNPYFVRPRSAQPVGASPPTCYTDRFYSFRHEWDPFVRWAPFLPDKLGIGPWGVDFVSPNPLTHFHSANVHGFTHYLDHPSVHVPIINRTLGFGAITAKEKTEAEAKHPKFLSGACQAEIDKLRHIIDDLPDSSGDLAKLAVSIAQFHAAARRAAQVCKELA